MTSLKEDEPKIRQGRAGTAVTPAPRVRKDKESWIEPGHAAKVEREARVTNREARAGGGQKAMGAMRTSRPADMR